MSDFDNQAKTILRFMDKEDERTKVSDSTDPEIRGRPIKAPGSTILNPDSIRYFFERMRTRNSFPCPRLRRWQGSEKRLPS
jgi:hypothetical protein